MSQKTVYIWGPVSSFTGPLSAWLVKKGWHVHIAAKSSLNLFSMSPLDLKSSAQSAIEQSFGGRDQVKAFKDKFKIINRQEIEKSTKYDAIIFAGMPPNFDESRTPRAPWSAAELKDLIGANKETPVFVVSSIFGGIQNDGVVPEQIEFERRKPLSNWENICQQYENKLLDSLSACEAPWYLVRLPMLCGATDDGSTMNYTGVYSLLKVLDKAINHADSPENDLDNDLDKNIEKAKELTLSYHPDSIFWYLPVDMATYVFWRYLEDVDRPRILNLVATNACLNREWLENAVSAIGATSLVQAEEDRLDLPQAIRRLLVDEIQVSNRNLFEVAGRYHVPPVKADIAYFQKILERARSNNWGENPAMQWRKTGSQEEQTIAYSDKVISYYFEEFLPVLLNTGGLLDRAIDAGHEIGFLLKEASDLSFVIKQQGGTSTTSRLEPNAKRPKICFILSGKTLLRLIQSKLPLHRALIMREVVVKGPIIETMKVTNLVERFLKEHPLTSEHLKEAEVYS
ncbi:MAG: SCP2 sterol-binding domain-containing protein [Candidatus Obscuribacterales bacterium]|nr:SCP2 sterol-binding domain-containing protein [Candidatus Obscuribacterales bacterium]